MFDSDGVALNFVGIWLWIVMPPRRKLSILDRGLVLAWSNHGVRNCYEPIEITLTLSNLQMYSVVSISQRSVHVVLNFLWLVYLPCNHFDLPSVSSQYVSLFDEIVILLDNVEITWAVGLFVRSVHESVWREITWAAGLFVRSMYEPVWWEITRAVGLFVRSV